MVTTASQAFLFDNDGVLIDSSELHWKSWQLFMQEEPRFFMTHEQFIHGFGKRNDLILRETVPTITEDEIKKWASRKESLFRKCAQGNITLIPGMEAFLKKVKEKNIPRIIASSTPLENLEMFISSTILGNYFNHYVSAEQVAHGKPSPDIFLEAAKKLGFAPQNCIVMEDAPAGIQAGKRAGCFVVALATTHSKEVLMDYDLLYSTPHELDLETILQRHREWQSKSLTH